MKKSFIIVVLVAASFLLTACAHESNLHSVKEREMTLGVVQKEIRTGMSQASVAETLGSPNIVTRDEDGLETWVYDKIATEASYSQSKGDVAGAVGAGAMISKTMILGGVGGSYGGGSGASSSTQKTLTVVIKFNKNSEVSTFSYHMSKF
jgi:outer membrane protein assembly factor BamE (lipoprotein component of BamABCDE complex)